MVSIGGVVGVYVSIEGWSWTHNLDFRLLVGLAGMYWPDDGWGGMLSLYGSCMLLVGVFLCGGYVVLGPADVWYGCY